MHLPSSFMSKALQEGFSAFVLWDVWVSCMWMHAYCSCLNGGVLESDNCQLLGKTATSHRVSEKSQGPLLETVIQFLFLFFINGHHLKAGGGLGTKSCLTLAIPLSVARWAPLSMGFSRHKYWCNSVLAYLMDFPLSSSALLPSWCLSKNPPSYSWLFLSHSPLVVH